MPDKTENQMSYPIRDENKIGLIDIGSSSIRLVIYRAGGRLPHPQFNERDVCRLGEGLAETGMLNQNRVDQALTTLRRFAEIMKASGLDEVKAFATEAVRKAQNSAEFINTAEDIIKSPIKILSGREEAQFAGKGVLSGFVDVDGLVGDLGGGSLELIHVKNMVSVKNQPQASLPCGHMVALEADDVDEMISALDWAETAKGKVFYAVGGTWRAIATAYTAASKKRIDVVHGLTLPRKDLIAMIKQIEEADGQIKGIPPARRSSMKQAVTVMRAIIKVFDPEEVVFSSYGAREGLLYDELSNDIRRIDPLLAGVAEFAAMTERYQGLGPALAEKVLPFLETYKIKNHRLTEAVSYLADLSWLDHPDYRASLAIEKMLGLSVVGINHKDRAWMAAVLSVRYSGSFPSRSLFRGMLKRKERETARFVGLVMRMLMTATGGMPALLDQITVTPQKKSLTISFPKSLFGNDQGVIMRRVKAISLETQSKKTITVEFIK